MCPVGTYGKGGGICAQCSPGTFGNATVGGAVTPAEACSACPPGRYAPAYGASACVTPRLLSSSHPPAIAFVYSGGSTS